MDIIYNLPCYMSINPCLVVDGAFAPSEAHFINQLHTDSVSLSACTNILVSKILIAT